MVFSSTFFIFAFLPLTLICYYAAFGKCHIDAANVVLLIASCIFYAWGGVKYFLILALVIAADFLLCLLMDKQRGFARRCLLFLILAIDIANLLYFKYCNFFVENARELAAAFGADILGDAANVALPIGISFYTFQIISYVVDVYLGKVPVQKSLVKLALYVTMFPQLIAGPIVRYTDINNEMDSRCIRIADIEYGIKRFIIGFFKKVFLANAMGSMADLMFSMPEYINTVYAWLGAICYALQIYYDFSAYSDMAIGLGKALGFNFNENFNLPYVSQSIQEFWRRWHISLSSWFRDYVYIPLGGNRRGKVRTYINLFIVFFLTGFWHGAAWQFIVWGLYHGVFLIIERLGFGRVLKKLPRLLQHVYTMVVVIVGWVFFRADNLTQAMLYLKAMFSLNLTKFGMYSVMSKLDSIFIICFIVAVIFSFRKINISRADNHNYYGADLGKSGTMTKVFTDIMYLALWLISVLYLTGLSYNPFIYFKF